MITPTPPPPPPPQPREEVLTLADEVSAPPRPIEPRPPEPRFSPPSVRAVTYPVPKSFEFSRSQPRRTRPALFRIVGITAVCLLGALATAGWYSRKNPAAPRYSAVASAPAIVQPPVSAAPPAAPTPETAPVSIEPATPAPKLHAVVPAHAEPQPAEDVIAEPPAREIAAPKLPPAAPAAVEAPSLALSAPSPMPALVAPQAAAPKIHHSEAAPARLEYRVPPQYPVVALKRHISGQVVLSLLVRKDGSVADVKMLSGNALFRDSAVEAVRKWRYSPATLDGQTVEATAQVVLKFDLPAEGR